MKQTPVDIAAERFAKGEISFRDYQSFVSVMLNAKEREAEVMARVQSLTTPEPDQTPSME